MRAAATLGDGRGRAGGCVGGESGRVGEARRPTLGQCVEASTARRAGAAQRWVGERGQASVELLGLLPAVLILALVGLQLLAVGYASVLAGSAAEAGALALAADADAVAGAREALPGWSRAHAQVSVSGDRVVVRLRPPTLLDVLARRLEVRSSAQVELP